MEIGHNTLEKLNLMVHFDLSRLPRQNIENSQSYGSECVTFGTAFSHVSRFASCKFPLDFRMRRSIGRLSARLRSARFTEVARSLEEIDAENDR